MSSNSKRKEEVKQSQASQGKNAQKLEATAKGMTQKQLDDLRHAEKMKGKKSTGTVSPRTAAKDRGMTQQEYQKLREREKSAQKASKSPKNTKSSMPTPDVPNVPPSAASNAGKSSDQGKKKKKTKVDLANTNAAKRLSEEVRAARVIPSLPKKDVIAQLEAFLTSSAMKLDLPCTLTAADRAAFHKLARKHGITSVSTGDEKLGTRALHLTKPPSMQAVQMRAHTRANSQHPLQALTGASLDNCLDLQLRGPMLQTMYSLLTKHNAVLRWAWQHRKEVVATTVSDVSVAQLQNDYDLDEDMEDEDSRLHQWTDPETYYWKPPTKAVPAYHMPPMHPNRPTDLPSFGVRDLFLHCMEENQVVIVAGATGCGKSTQFPQFIFDYCRAQKKPCRIVITQPRRLAAMSLARRVAFERGHALTETETEDVRETTSRSREDDEVEKLWTTARNLSKLSTEAGRDVDEIIGEEMSELLDTADTDALAALDAGVAPEGVDAAPEPIAVPVASTTRPEHGHARGKQSYCDVGYIVRHNRGSADAPIVFCTIGVLLRKLTDSRRPLPAPANAEEAYGRALKPTDAAFWVHTHSPLVTRLRMSLRSITHIIIDEVHERGKLTDFALCLLKSALYALPSLKLIVMSATINGPLLSTYFGGAPIIEAQGRTFPVTVFHAHDVVQLAGYTDTLLSDPTSLPPAVKSAETLAMSEISKAMRVEAGGGVIPPVISTRPVGPGAAQPVTVRNPYYCGNGMRYTADMLQPRYVWHPTNTCPSLPPPSDTCGDVCACRVARYGLLACAAISAAQKKAPAMLNTHVPLVVSLLRWIVDRVDTHTATEDPEAAQKTAEKQATLSSLHSMMASAAYGSATATDAGAAAVSLPATPLPFTFDLPIITATANALASSTTSSAEDRLAQLLRSVAPTSTSASASAAATPLASPMQHNAGDVDSAGEVLLAPVHLADFDSEHVRAMRQCSLPHGAVLVFLPGWSEIATMTDAIAADPILGNASRCVVLQLHSAVPLQQQQQVFEPAEPGVWKVVLCTNIAETSVTIPDAVYVIDMCTAKVKGYDAANDMATFNVEWVARANAIQRAGRAGRVRPGYCFRLCSEAHMASLEQDELPELLRTGLEDVVLQVKTLLKPPVRRGRHERSHVGGSGGAGAGAGAGEEGEDDQRGHVACFLARALQPPARSHVFSAIQSLQRVGGLDEMERMTVLGEVYQALPLEPRYARMLLWAVGAGVLDAALTIVAIAGSNVLAVVSKEQRPQQNQLLRILSKGTNNDLIALVNVYNAWVGSGRFPYDRKYFAKSAMLSHNALLSVGKTRRQLFRHISQLPHLRKALGVVSVNKFGDMVYLKPQAGTVGPTGVPIHTIQRFAYVDECFRRANQFLTNPYAPADTPAERDDPTTLPLCNSNAYEDHVVGTLLTMSMYPSVAVAQPGKSLKVTTRLGVTAGVSNRSVAESKVASPVVVGFNECIHMMGQVIVSGIGITTPLALATGMPLMAPSASNRTFAMQQRWGHVPHADDAWVQACTHYLLDHTRAQTPFDKRAIDGQYLLPDVNYGTAPSSDVCLAQCLMLQYHFADFIEKMVSRLGSDGGAIGVKVAFGHLEMKLQEISAPAYTRGSTGEAWELVTTVTSNAPDFSDQLGTVSAQSTAELREHTTRYPLPGSSRAEAALYAGTYLSNIITPPPAPARTSLLELAGTPKVAAYYMDDMVAAKAPSHTLPLVILLRTAVAVLTQRAAIGVAMGASVGFEAGLHRAATALLRDIALVCGREPVAESGARGDRGAGASHDSANGHNRSRGGGNRNNGHGSSRGGYQGGNYHGGSYDNGPQNGFKTGYEDTHVPKGSRVKEAYGF